MIIWLSLTNLKSNLSELKTKASSASISASS